MLPHQKQHLEQIAIKFFSKTKEPLFVFMDKLCYSDEVNIRDAADQVIFYGYENKDLYREMLKSFVLLCIVDFNDAKYEMKRMLVNILSDEYEKSKSIDING